MNSSDVISSSSCSNCQAFAAAKMFGVLSPALLARLSTMRKVLSCGTKRCQCVEPCWGEVGLNLSPSGRETLIAILAIHIGYRHPAHDTSRTITELPRTDEYAAFGWPLLRRFACVSGVGVGALGFFVGRRAGA